MEWITPIITLALTIRILLDLFVIIPYKEKRHDKAVYNNSTGYSRKEMDRAYKFYVGIRMKEIENYYKPSLWVSMIKEQ